MKILFVDEKEILLDGIANLLAKSVTELVESANTVDDALNYFSDAEFYILITDFNLVDDNGLNLIRKAKKIYPKLQIIVLSMHDEAHLIKEILNNGDNNYKIKKGSHQHLAEALEASDTSKLIINGDINKIIIGALNQNKKSKLLSNREKEILALISDDFTTQKIAEKLAITEKTSEGHYKSLLKKTKTSSVIGLLKYAYANNLI
ncbi:MAG: DNA-binding response regulator [Bacteroidetes bacterium]|nr:MAG: DNA-binding response regulator [Bacteroidota bacterium]